MKMFCRALVCRGGGFHDVHAATVFVELHRAALECEERPIAARADIRARHELAAALADDDAAGSDDFAAIRLHAETLADAVASVPYAALTFFMCHKPEKLRFDFFDLHHGQ